MSEEKDTTIANVKLVQAFYDEKGNGARHRFTFDIGEVSGVVWTHPDKIPLDGIAVMLKITPLDLSKIRHRIKVRREEQ